MQYFMHPFKAKSHKETFAFKYDEEGEVDLGRTGLRSPELLTGSCLVVGLSNGLVRGGELYK